MAAPDILLFAQIGGGPRGGAGFGAGGPTAADVGMSLMVTAVIYFVVFLVIGIPTAIGMWKTFTKAGQPGWPAIFFFLPPVYCYFIGEISGKGGGYGLMVGIGLCLPCVGLIALIFYVIMLIDFCKAYDQGAGMAIGLLLLSPIFWLILGFGVAEYVGAPGSRGGRRSRRRRDYDEDDDYDRPRGKRLDYDDDEDDRPRRSRPDDDDDPPRRPDDRVRRKPRFDDY